MAGRLTVKPLARSARLAILSLVATIAVTAEQLPIKTYTTSEGLAHNRISQIVQDSRGYIWIPTVGGLARFDGYRFRTFSVADGLPFYSINCFLETRAGVYWVATNGGGVARFNTLTAASPTAPLAVKPQEPGSYFTAYRVGETPRTNRVNVIYEDQAGGIWAGTDGGLFRFDPAADRFEPIALGLPGRPDLQVFVWTILDDCRGSLWIGVSGGLIRYFSDGRTLHYGSDGRTLRYSSFPEVRFQSVYNLRLDRAGRLWAAGRGGLLVLDPPPASETADRERPAWRRLLTHGLPETPGEARYFTRRDGLGGEDVRVVLPASDGRIWVGYIGGISLFDGLEFRNFTLAHGLTSINIGGLTEDRAGNIWIASADMGAMKLTRNGFLNYDERDGLTHRRVVGLTADPSGRVVVLTDQWSIHGFDGERLRATRLNLPARHFPLSRRILLDRAGQLWVPTREGLYRFPHLARLADLGTTPPLAHYTARDGMAEDDVFTLFEDSRGDLWFSPFSPGAKVLTRWERATGKFHAYGEGDGLPTFNAAVSFAEDRAGRIWMAFREGGVARYAEGRFTFFRRADGLPPSPVNQILLARTGRLWVGTIEHGLGYIEDPEASHPRFVFPGTESTIPRPIRVLSEDSWGWILCGTDYGLVRFDPATGRVKQYTTEDGLANNVITALYHEPEGDLWIGTTRGLSRLHLGADQPSPPAPVLISGLRIAGVPYDLPVVGAAAIAVPTLSTNQNQLQIDYLGLGFSPGEVLRYQYKLEGADEDWNPPTNERTINYANLAPGDYRFLVRGVNAQGQESPTPAVAAFRILPPIWLRWWFLTLAAGGLLAGLIIAARFRMARTRERQRAEEELRRSREERFRELERVRRRIAVDLHDDIGSSLTQISILSEIVSQRIGPNGGQVREPLAQIAATSRELIDSMSDIVWAINPQKDHLSDLVQRMRRFASDSFTARNIAFQFTAPEAAEDFRLGANVRREVFLIYKESVNNALRHSGCSRMEIMLRAEAGSLLLGVSDDGRGFDTSSESEGHGLASMRDRSADIGAELLLVSSPGLGTSISLRVPLNRNGSEFTTRMRSDAPASER